MKRLLVFLFLAAATGCAPAPGSVGVITQARGIQVTGEGRVTTVPDVAVVNLGVEARATTASEARRRAAAGMETMAAAIRRLGVAERDIQTQRFSLTQFREREFGREVTGFRAVNTVRVKVRDIDQTGKIVDDAVAAAGDLVRVERITFTVDDPTPFYSQAREQALADARTKAEALAKGAGVSLGQPQSIFEGALRVPVPAMALGRGGELGVEAPTPIFTGETEIVLTIQVNYAIER